MTTKKRRKVIARQVAAELMDNLIANGLIREPWARAGRMTNREKVEGWIVGAIIGAMDREAAREMPI